MQQSTMVETKNRKKTITEEDISLLLQRYSATSILALLQEVSQFAGIKIDWNALVKQTSTGITCPREYQMLWRHLAYRDSLVDKLEVNAEPLDDDSDLEFEIEAYPAISCEASVEAAACVKVLMSSSLTSDSGPSLVAPLTINIPNSQASHLPSDKQQTACATQNITISVSVKKKSLPALTSDGVDGNGPSSSKQPVKKKRKQWTPEEDMALRAAVDKFGEGNWQNIVKEDFKHDRTASQLSQRWSILRKKSNLGTTNSSNNPALTEAQLSTRQAIYMALNMPTIGSLPAICSGNTPSSTVLPAAQSEPSPLFSPKAPIQSHQALPQPAPQKMPNVPLNKPRPTQVKHLGLVKPLRGPNPLIQQAALAAGGRIITSLTAASLFKSTQSKIAVHVRPGSALSVSTVPGAKASLAASSVVHRPTSVGQTRMSSAVNSGMAPTSTGPGSQQATSVSAKPSQAPVTNAVLHTSSLLPLGEPKSVVPVLGDARGNTNATAVSARDLLELSNRGADPVSAKRNKVAIAAEPNEVSLVKVDDGEDMDITPGPAINENGKELASTGTIETANSFAGRGGGNGTRTDSIPQEKPNASEDLDLVVKPRVRADENLNFAANQETDEKALVDGKMALPDVARDEIPSANMEGIEARVSDTSKREAAGCSSNKEDQVTMDTRHDDQNVAGKLQMNISEMDRRVDDASQVTPTSPSDVKNHGSSG